MPELAGRLDELHGDLRFTALRASNMYHAALNRLMSGFIRERDNLLRDNLRSKCDQRAVCVDHQGARFFFKVLIIGCLSAYKNGNAEQHAHAAAAARIGLPARFWRCGRSHKKTIALRNVEGNGTPLPIAI